MDGLDLTGKAILVTGCNSGLGAATMRALCVRGAQVIGTARTLEKATTACNQTPGKALPVVCDLSEPSSVRAAVASVRRMGHRLDAVIANAGVMALRGLEQKHGYELQYLSQTTSATTCWSPGCSISSRARAGS